MIRYRKAGRMDDGIIGMILPMKQGKPNRPNERQIRKESGPLDRAAPPPRPLLNSLHNSTDFLMRKGVLRPPRAQNYPGFGLRSKGIAVRRGVAGVGVQENHRRSPLVHPIILFNVMKCGGNLRLTQKAILFKGDRAVNLGFAGSALKFARDALQPLQGF